MKRTWLSLFYETGYLLVAGVFLLVAPDTAFKLLFSNNSYGDVLPRLFGTVLLSIGAIFVQIVRMHIEGLLHNDYRRARTAHGGQPMALHLFGQATLLDAVRIVTLGVVLTVAGYVLDQKSKINDIRT